jgi:hypothetical protein
MIEKRCFLQSFMVTLAYAVAAFFAWRYGLLQSIWYSDTTYMTSLIGVIFVAAVGYLNFAAWRYDSKWNRWRDSIANADIGLGHFAASSSFYAGLLGTVIGLMAQFQALGAVDATKPETGVAFIGATAVALKTAFYATGCGIAASALISVIVANLNYFLDRNEVLDRHEVAQ